MTRVLASAPSLEGIKGAISRFYGGQDMDLLPGNDGQRFIVHVSGGAEIRGVWVSRRRNRFLFEAEDS